VYSEGLEDSGGGEGGQRSTGENVGLDVEEFGSNGGVTSRGGAEALSNRAPHPP
jgi:hypothetical protein